MMNSWVFTYQLSFWISLASNKLESPEGLLYNNNFDTRPGSPRAGFTVGGLKPMSFESPA